MYEARTQAPLHPRAFTKRMLAHALVALALLGGSLAIGMFGYHQFEHLSWLDAFLNAAMLLGGMGPVETPATPAGKLFAGLYALYAGIVFIATAAVIFTPVAHRIVHNFHWDPKP